MNEELRIKFQESYDKLNPAQKDAVDTIDGPLLVLAGPGTGKTQILSARVARILQETDTAAQNILCLTFTETGAQNMRELIGWYAKGQLKPHICAHFPLDRGAEAIRMLMDRKAQGKVIVTA